MTDFEELAVVHARPVQYACQNLTIHVHLCRLWIEISGNGGCTTRLGHVADMCTNESVCLEIWVNRVDITLTSRR